MKGPPLSRPKAASTILLAAAAAWGLWFTNSVVYHHAVWQHQDCYKLTEAIVVSVITPAKSKAGRGGRRYWADVTVEGKPVRMNLIGFREFDQSLIKEGRTAQYTGLAVPVYHCSSAPASRWFTNRGLKLIPADIDIRNAGRRFALDLCIAYSPFLLLAASLSVLRTIRRPSEPARKDD